MIKIECEGADGAGKTTGLKYLIEQARARGLKVVETREVGNPNIPICTKLRETVLDPNSGLSGESMELIFSAMRVENDRWLKNLRNSPERPDLVVSDRGWFSHLAYTDHNVSEDFTNMLYGGVLGKITEYPEVVIYFDVNTETALKRRVKRGEGMDVIEMKGVEFQEKVRKSFEHHMMNHTVDHNYNYDDKMITFFTVDANQDLDGVKGQLDMILNIIAPRTAAWWCLSSGE